MVSEISTIEKIHDQVKVLTILESIVHVHKKGAIKLRKNLSFIHYTFYTSFCQYPCFAHLLHGIFVLIFLSVYLPDFAKTTFANAKRILETGFAYRYK